MKTPHAVSIHHSAVIRDGNENGKEIAKAYTRYHNGNMPYHFLITRKESEPIWCTQWVTQYTWHNGNINANKDCIAICVDGNFQAQDPSKTQLKKLKQLLDDLSSNWFQKNNWVAFETHINPKENTKTNNYSGYEVYDLHYHNEVSIKPEWATACCGKSLIPYVVEYRTKQGNVDWGSTPTPPPDPCKEIRQELDKCRDDYKILDEKYTQKHTELEKLKGDYTKLEKEKEALETTLTNKDLQIERMQTEIDNKTPSFEAIQELYSILEIESGSQTPEAVTRRVKLLQLQKDNVFILVFKAIIKWIVNLRSKK